MTKSYVTTIAKSQVHHVNLHVKIKEKIIQNQGFLNNLELLLIFLDIHFKILFSATDNWKNINEVIYKQHVRKCVLSSHFLIARNSALNFSLLQPLAPTCTYTITPHYAYMCICTSTHTHTHTVHLSMCICAGTHTHTHTQSSSVHYAGM